MQALPRRFQHHFCHTTTTTTYIPNCFEKLVGLAVILQKWCWRVSPFGYLRIKGYKPPPRSFSQVSRVLHSRPRPRHPPCTLMSLVRRPEYHNYFIHPPSPSFGEAGTFSAPTFVVAEFT